MKKAVIPSLREKKRYLAFEVIGSPDFLSVQAAIASGLESYLGKKGVAEAGAIYLQEKYNGKRGLIRVSHTSLDKLRASLALITHVGGKPAIIRSVGASGSMKKAMGYLRV